MPMPWSVAPLACSPRVPAVVTHADLDRGSSVPPRASAKRYPTYGHGRSLRDGFLANTRYHGEAASPPAHQASLLPQLLAFLGSFARGSCPAIRIGGCTPDYHIVRYFAKGGGLRNDVFSILGAHTTAASTTGLSKSDLIPEFAVHDDVKGRFPIWMAHREYTDDSSILPEAMKKCMIYVPMASRKCAISDCAGGNLVESSDAAPPRAWCRSRLRAGHERHRRIVVGSLHRQLDA